MTANALNTVINIIISSFAHISMHTKLHVQNQHGLPMTAWSILELTIWLLSLQCILTIHALLALPNASKHALLQLSPCNCSSQTLDATAHVYIIELNMTGVHMTGARQCGKSCLCTSNA